MILILVQLLVWRDNVGAYELPFRSLRENALFSLLAPSLRVGNNFLKEEFASILMKELLLKVIGISSLEKIPELDYALSYSGRNKERKWLWTQIITREKKMFLSLIKKAGEEGYISRKEETLLAYAVSHKVVTPEELDIPLSRTSYFKSTDAVKRSLFGRSEREQITVGMYMRITNYLKQHQRLKDKELREYIERCLMKAMSGDIVRFIRDSKSAFVEQAVNDIFDYWGKAGTSSEKFQANIYYFITHPEITLENCAAMCAISKKGLEKQIRKANKDILEVSDKVGKKAELLRTLKLKIYKTRGCDLKVLMDYKMPLKDFQHDLEILINSMSRTEISCADLSFEQTKELIILRLVYLKSYKELSRYYQVSEITINRFFEGRRGKGKRIDRKGAVENFRDFLKARVDSLEKSIRGLALDPQKRTVKNFRAKLRLFIVKFQTIYPEYRSNQMEYYKEIIRILDNDSLRYFLTQESDITQEKIVFVLEKFYSQRVDDFKHEAILELSNIAFRFSENIFSHDKEKTREILMAHSSIARDFSVSVYGYLFKELGADASVFSQESYRGFRYIQNLMKNSSGRSSEAVRLALDKTTRHFWKIYPQLNGDYLAVYRIIARESGFKSLEKFTRQTSDIKKIKQMFYLFFSEKHKEFKNHLLSDMQNIIWKSPRIFNLNNEQIISKFTSESRYVKSFGFEVYKEFFPEFFTKDIALSQAILELNKSYLRIKLLQELYEIGNNSDSMWNSAGRMNNILELNSSFFAVYNVDIYKQLFPEFFKNEPSFYKSMWLLFDSYRKKEEEELVNKLMDLISRPKRNVVCSTMLESSI